MTYEIHSLRKSKSGRAAKDMALAAMLALRSSRFAGPEQPYPARDQWNPEDAVARG